MQREHPAAGAGEEPGLARRGRSRRVLRLLLTAFLPGLLLGAAASLALLTLAERRADALLHSSLARAGCRGAVRQLRLARDATLVAPELEVVRDGLGSARVEQLRLRPGSLADLLAGREGSWRAELVGWSLEGKLPAGGPRLVASGGARARCRCRCRCAYLCEIHTNPVDSGSGSGSATVT